MKTKPLLLAMLLLAVRVHAVDGSLSFSGTAGQFVQVLNFDGLQVTNEVTVEFWALPDDAAQRSLFILDADTGANRFQAHLPWESGEFIWDFGNIEPPLQTGRLVVAAPSGSVGSWRHYALVATQSGNAMRIYQNGTLIASKTGMDALEATNNTFLRIGGNALAYKGKLDDFRIWNVARTGAQISAGMVSPPLGNEPNLRLYLRFDEGSGTTAVNSATATGATFNGTLNGAIIRAASPFTSVVMNNANSGPGSLRQAIADAAVQPGANTITFDPTLSGQTLTLSSEIVVADTAGVTVDASTLPGGITLTGGNAKRLFSFSPGSSATLRGLTLTGGNGVGATDSGRGGAIYNNSATLTLDRCTLRSNTGNATFSDGGAIFNNFGSLALTNCTLTANTATWRGGAIFSNGPLTLTHCTVTDNSTTISSAEGGGVFFENAVAFTLENSIVTDNTVPTSGFGHDILCDNGTLTRLGANLVQDLETFGTTVNGSGTVSNAAPNLAALASNGGPTQTRMPNVGSPAIDAAVGSTAATDQRGLSRPQDGDGNGSALADIGAVERPGSAFLVVQNNADSGAGSLRQVLADAAAAGGVRTVTFAPGLSGQTITLSSEIIITNVSGVTVDASSLAGGITVSGNSDGDVILEPGESRIFTITSGTTATLRGLRLINGMVDLGTGYGGAVYNAGQLTMERCQIESSRAVLGGGLINLGTMTLIECAVSGNSCNWLGGGVCNLADSGAPATLTLTRCTIAGNASSDTYGAGNGGIVGGGGGIMSYGGTVTISQSTIANNTASGTGAYATGGGIQAIGNLTITHSTIAGNSTTTNNDSKSGGLAFFGDPATVTNSIIAGNTGGDVYNFGGTFDFTGQNIVQNVTGDTFLMTGAPINAAPLLGPLASNGGPTKTMALLPGSPAIDAASVVPGLTTDQRGIARNVDGDGNGSAAPDIGAYEHQRIVVTTATDELNTPSDNGGTGLSLREAIRDGAGTIVFAPGLSGQTITLGSELVIASSVALDASGLPGGLTLTDAGVVDYRLMSVSSGSTVTLRGLTLANGDGGSVDDFGGAILNEGTLTLTQCILSGNSADSSGGAIVNGGTLTLTQCTLSDNSADNFGGAIRNYATLTLTQCTLSGNSAAFGGAIRNEATLTLTQCTLSGNSGSISGGAISNEGTLTLTNSLVAGNTAGSGPNILQGSGTITAQGVNLIGNLADSELSAGATVLVNANPGLAALASNGGPTQTMALLPGSPAINAAAVLNPAITTDQRGQPIVGAPDIGAYERQFSTSVTTTADSGEGSLREALLDAAALPGPNIITFAGNFTGPIVLNSELVINDTASVTIDASALPTLLTLDGGTGANRILDVRAGASVTLRRLRFTGGNGGGEQQNTAGGALNNQGTLTVIECAFEANSAAAGGAINSQGTLVVSQSSFVANSASFGGAIHSHGSGLLTVSGSTFLNNTAVDRGGAVLENDADSPPGHPTLARCTFHGNTAFRGGAVGSFSLTNLTHCTLSGNTASGMGGGVLASATSVVTLTNCVVAGNQNAGSPDLGIEGTGVLATAGVNLVGNLTGSGLSAGPALLTGDPLLAPIADYGGPTQTRALLPGSPARNAATGSNFVPNASFETDTFGGSFVITNTLPGGAITGWTSSPSNRTGLCINGSPFTNGGLITDGAKAAWVQCFMDGVATTLSTTLTGLTVGTNYTVTFRTAGRQGPVPGSTWSINGSTPVIFDGSVVGAGQPFRTITGSFTATASTAALAFTNQSDINTDTSVLIDAVTVAPTTPATDQRGFPIVGVPDLGAYEAGTPGNFYVTAAENGTSTNPDSDTDNDGRSALLEYATQSDPQAASNNEITPTTFNQNAAGAVTQANVTFPTRVGATDLLYTLQRSTTLTGAWSTVVTWNSTTGVLSQASGVTASRNPGTGLVSVTDTNVNGEDNAFYRLEVTQQ